MDQLDDNSRKSFHTSSLKRFSRLLDTGLTDAQLDICLALIERKLVNPEALANVVIQLKDEATKLTR